MRLKKEEWAERMRTFVERDEETMPFGLPAAVMLVIMVNFGDKAEIEAEDILAVMNEKALYEKKFLVTVLGLDQQRLSLHTPQAQAA